MDRHDELPRLERQKTTLLCDDLVEGLLGETLEEDVQIELGESHFNLTVPRILPQLIKGASVDEGKLG